MHEDPRDKFEEMVEIFARLSIRMDPEFMADSPDYDPDTGTLSGR